MIKFAIVTSIAVGLMSVSSSAHASDQVATDEDVGIMQQCIEAVRDVNANLQSGQRRASSRDCIGAASSKCMDNPIGASTFGMVECVSRETNWWDAQLNGHYEYLKQNLDTPLFGALRDVQRKWIAYKDAACQFEYDSWGVGTIRQPATASCFLDITAIRALELGELADRVGQ